MPPPIDYEAFDEKCLVRLMNYRDPAAEDAGNSAQNVSQSKDFSRTSKEPAAAEPELNSQVDGGVSETSSHKAARQADNF